MTRSAQAGAVRQRAPEIDGSELRRGRWRERLFRHPLVGDLHLEQHRLTPSDHPDLNLLVYTPVVTTEAPARLRKLLKIVSAPAEGNPDHEE